jgi:hypothetical protein
MTFVHRMTLLGNEEEEQFEEEELFSFTEDPERL